MRPSYSCKEAKERARLIGKIATQIEESRSGGGMPHDEKRTQTLQRIHENWPKDDAAGAAAFAQKHGIKP